jgi:hypothetical protein
MAREASPPSPEPGADEAGGGKPAASTRTKRIVTGAAIGIGSAALVAALLYANRSRKGGDKPG